MQCTNYSQQSLSWFNLFEPVTKKERERALFCCRLLSHSVESESFRHQILGDVYLSLNEIELALSSYHEAFSMAAIEKDIYGVLVIGQKIAELTNDVKGHINLLKILIGTNNLSHSIFLSEILAKYENQENL